MDLPNFIGQTSIGEVAMTILLIANAFFLTRYFRQSDSLANTLTNLDKTIAVLSEKIETLQNKDANKDKLIERLMSKVIKLQQIVIKLRAEFYSCRETCKEKENG